jgi:hypothetical protein
VQQWRNNSVTTVHLHKGGELRGEVTQTLALGVTESAGPDKQVRLVAE